MTVCYNFFIKVAAPELIITENWNKMAKSDAKEVQPIINTAETRHPNIPNDARGGDSHVATDEDDEENSQSWHKILDPELQPEQPIQDNKESMEIYSDHSRLAKEYFIVETELYFAQQIRSQVLQDMNPEERKQKEELLQKFKDREELLELYNNLKSSILTSEDIQPTTECGASSYNTDVVPDDSWVVINSNNQNS